MPSNPLQDSQVAIYARVSTEEQREGQTIDSQVAELEKFALEKNWKIIEVYRDEGWSGSLLARPELDRLRDDAARGRFDTLLINDVDRLARDVSHLGIIKRDLEHCGVQVIFKKLPAEKSPTYNLMVNILGSFAEFERELIADRMRRGRRHKVEVRQQFLGSNPAYGFQYIPKDRNAGKEGYLKLVQEQATVVRQMYEWVDREGLSVKKVVDRLNALGYVPRKGGKKWAKSSVLRILRSEIYAGVWHYNKFEACEPVNPANKSKYRRTLKSSLRRRPRSEWLPVILPAELRIVDRGQWKRAQEQLNRNTTFSPRNTKHNYLLKGLVRCGRCNAPYVGDPNHGRFYYRCHARCKQLQSVRDIHLDSAVWNAVVEAIQNPSLIFKQVEEFHRRKLAHVSKINDELKEIDLELDQIRKEEDRLLEAYRLAIIKPSQLSREMEKINLRKASLERRKASLINRNESQPLAEVQHSLTSYCRTVARRIGEFSFEERQRFLRLIINQIVFEGEQVRIRGIIPLPTGISSSAAQVESDDVNETTVIDSCDLNPVSWNTTLRSRRNENISYNLVDFELVKSLPHKPFSIMSPEGLTLIRNLAEEQAGSTLKKWCYQIELECGVRVSLSSMNRALLRAGISASKQSPRRHINNSKSRGQRLAA